MTGKNKRIKRIVNIQVAEAHIKKGLKEMGCTDPICRIDKRAEDFKARISVGNLRGVVDIVHGSLDGLVGAVTSAFKSIEGGLPRI